MILITLLQARSSLWSYASGVPYATATTAQKLEVDTRINHVCEELLLHAKPRNTMRRVTLPIYDDQITLPRNLLSCSGIKLIPEGNDVTWQQPLRIYGMFHEFHNGPIPVDDCTGAIYPASQLAQTFRDPSAGFTLRVKATEAGGNMSLICGTDSTDTELFGTVSLAITNGTTTTTQVWNTLPQIQKPATTGKVELYSVIAGVETLIAVYAPGETVPAYTRYLVANPGTSPSCFALCKLGYVPAVADSDIVFPGVITALRRGLRALNREIAEQEDAADKLWASAHDALDRDRQQLDGDTFTEFQVEPSVGFGDIPFTI